MIDFDSLTSAFGVLVSFFRGFLTTDVGYLFLALVCVGCLVKWLFLPFCGKKIKF